MAGAQAADKDKEPIAILEIGGAAERTFPDGDTSIGPSVAVEFTVIKDWLETLAEGKVRARFEVLRGKVAERAVEKTAISKAWVIEKLVENVERAMQAEPVRRKITDREEEMLGEYIYNGNVANKALELIGKELGMFIDRKEVGGPNEFERMSDEELEAFLLESMDSLSLLHNERSKH